MRHKPIPNLKRTELDIELLGIAATNAFLKEDSSSRLQMFCSHLGQALVVKGSTVRRCQSGIERELAKATFNIKAPCNMIVRRVIQKYPPSVGRGAISQNPTSLLIYENVDSPQRELGVMELPRHHCIHQYYGFQYKPARGADKIYQGGAIGKDTVIADSPNVTENGDYKYGAEVNTVMMSIHPEIEDGLVISESMQKDMTTVAFDSRVIRFGKNTYPLNLDGYGIDGETSAFPEIGQRIRADGLLFALREYDDFLAAVDMTEEGLRTPNYNFDKTVYGVPNARVVDVIIHKGNQLRSNTPPALVKQCERYYERTIMFYKEILNEYNTFRKERGSRTPPISREFNRWYVEAMAMTNDQSEDRITTTFGRIPTDEWRVEVVFEYDVVPGVGSKLTDCHGGKGVVVAVWPDENMPVDKHGNRAKLITDDNSTVKRMNIGRVHEQTINAAGAYVTQKIRDTLKTWSKEEISWSWDYLLDYYKLVSPVFYNMIFESGVADNPRAHLEHIVKDGIYLYTPPDTPVWYTDVVDEIHKRYPDLVGPVTYTGVSGVPCTTVGNVMVGSMYIMLLEKMGNSWGSTASAKLQHYGVPAKLTNEDKYANPGRKTPIRVIGESEGRLITATCGGDIVADILDQTNNPTVHREICFNILHADKPSNIGKVIDRNKFPMGHDRVHAYANHFLECFGVRFERVRRKG